MLGLIGGTGLEAPPGAGFTPRRVTTPYGEVEVHLGPHRSGTIAFWSRHGVAHDTPPHAVPYRAGVWALRTLGVSQVVATAAVGSIRPEWKPGTLVRISDGIDRSWGRPSTFFDGPLLPVVHLEASGLYCPDLGRRLLATGERVGVPIVDGAVLAVTQGPRFETPAEVRALQAVGADLVGMTGFPEVVLARELGMCYATLGLVVNAAAGVGGAAIDLGALGEAAGAGRASVLSVIRELEVGTGPCPACKMPHGAPTFPWHVPA